ncbi:anhydro-N-acetylmuramic acid kinase [Litoribacillus peritrichatus]|uniref:Anhydro-N-acetylmuramic acid kinase n=2 Tax=Litoribacillus peritrichatus TaxID=718191 RepID=A0ABP7NEU5_9GAMM
MSGTSLDGLDLALCDFQQSDIVTHSHFLPFPQTLKSALFELSHLETINIAQLFQTENFYSQFCADTINVWLRSLNIPASNISALGIHGQTIRHHPELTPGFTAQLGNWGQIAAQTGITTVGDFRRKDIALQGQGAPLVPPFHNAFFQSDDKHRVILNIGGISNISILTPKTVCPNANPVGYDTGPGNALLDYWYSQHNSGEFDNNGHWAKQGTVIPELLSQCLQTAYFQDSPPKSTGRELFNPNWLTHQLNALKQSHSFSAQDIQTTLVELTATSICKEIESTAPNTQEVYVCGGGWKNSYLITRIRQLIGSQVYVGSTSDLGIQPDWIEACAFAWFAQETLAKRNIQQATTTGATRNALLGGIYYP